VAAELLASYALAFHLQQSLISACAAA